MSRLFWKIFIWFLVAMFLVGGTLVLSVASTRDEAADARFRSFASRVARLEAEHAAQVYEHEGPVELQRYLADMSEGRTERTDLFNIDGRAVLGTVHAP